MEPQEKTASPHQWRRTTTSGPEEDHSRTRRSNGWAECREKNIGIEPMENTFLLTFLLIGHCYRRGPQDSTSCAEGQKLKPGSHPNKALPRQVNLSSHCVVSR